MTVLESLKSARQGLIRVDALCERAKRLKKMAENAGSVAMVQNRGMRDSRQEKYLLEMMENREKLQREIQELMRQQKEAESLIYMLDDERYAAVLMLRYMTGLDWDEVAKKMGYGERWVKKLHNDAVSELERMMEDGSVAP